MCIYDIEKKTTHNEIWLQQISNNEQIPTQAIKTFCEDWIKEQQLKYKFESYPVNTLIGFMVADVRKNKDKLKPKEEKKMELGDWWN